MKTIISGLIIPLAAAALLAGCTTYKTPGAAVNLPALNESNIEKMLSTEAGQILPARIALVRVQASGYASATNSGYGSGRFSVIAARDIEQEADIARIAALPMVDGVVCFNRMLLPPTLGSIRDLRVIAAKLQADVLLVYTLDTVFRTREGEATPLSTLSFGWLEDKEVDVASNVSGMLVDVRSGFVYGLLNTTAQKTKREAFSEFSNQQEIDAFRLQSEQVSYSQFIDQFEQLWQDVLNRSGADVIKAVKVSTEAKIRC
jgi:hypothetical protein